MSVNLKRSFDSLGTDPYLTQRNVQPHPSITNFKKGVSLYKQGHFQAAFSLFYEVYKTGLLAEVNFERLSQVALYIQPNACSDNEKIEYSLVYKKIGEHYEARELPSRAIFMYTTALSLIQGLPRVQPMQVELLEARRTQYCSLGLNSLGAQDDAHTLAIDYSAELKTLDAVYPAEDILQSFVYEADRFQVILYWVYTRVDDISCLLNRALKLYECYARNRSPLLKLYTDGIEELLPSLNKEDRKTIAIYLKGLAAAALGMDDKACEEFQKIANRSVLEGKGARALADSLSRMH